LEDRYDAAEHEPFFERFDLHEFSDEEFAMCPPIFAIGGDGAMLDIGFQNLSRLLASGKPIRVMVLDTQVYSNTGGQACTSGFLGQISDMAAFGASQHGKTEVRKEMSLLAMAHRNVFVHQSSQANPSHLLSGVLRGLQTRRPSVFVLHCPCPPEHGLGDDAANRAARMALESRAFPVLTFDPDSSDSFSECLSLDGNPSADDLWPSYDLKYVEDGEEKTMAVPLTIADWTATEGRFKKHFRMIPEDRDAESLVPFSEYVTLPAGERADLTPFIYVIDGERHLNRLSVSPEIVELAQERLQFWEQLRYLAGRSTPDALRDEMSGALEAELEEKLASLRREYEEKMNDLKRRYPQLIARRMAEGLIAAGGGKETLDDLLTRIEKMPLKPIPKMSAVDVAVVPPDRAPPAPVGSGSMPEAATEAADSSAGVAVAEVDDETDDDLAAEPYIESARCTTCDECTQLNPRMFAYDEQKQAYFKDVRAGTFREMVMAAERCPVAIIHPGAPLNKKEKDLEKWMKRAEPFN
jgi:pyruvate-ferredoxin/flavodoxin oxidoreductase